MKELSDLARIGCSLEEIASRFNINRMTLWHWSQKYPEIQEAISSGKMVADQSVEHALYDSCFDHKVNEIYVEKDEEGNVVKSTVKTRIIPANVTAQQFWLSNRMRNTWKSKQELELVSNGNPIQINLVDDLKPFGEDDKDNTDKSTKKSVSKTKKTVSKKTSKHESNGHTDKPME